MIEITDNFNEDIQIKNDTKIGNAIVDVISIEITDNFNENYNLKSDNKIGSNVNLTEII